jgi:hypothetical protein
MLKYVSKFAMDILPSVAATIIGAYIVNHYIVAKPAAEAPPAAAVSAVSPKKAETRNEVANIPESGVRAKGISEKAIFEKSAVEKPQERSQEKPQEKSQEKSVEKSAEKPAETASIPVDTRRHQPAPREKATAKAVPAPVQPATPVAVPVIAAPNATPPVEAAIAPEEHRDANDLARAAIERLRGEGLSRSQEAARTPDPARVPEPSRVVSAPVVAAPQIRPLPPPIMVSTPAAEALYPAADSSPMKRPYPAAAGIDDPRRPTPPADIPDSQPLDLRAEAAEPPPSREHTTVAEDMLLAAKSVFHAVLPNSSAK